MMPFLEMKRQAYSEEWILKIVLSSYRNFLIDRKLFGTEKYLQIYEEKRMTNWVLEKIIQYSTHSRYPAGITLGENRN